VRDAATLGGPQTIKVGQVTRKVENGETTYQIRQHYPRGFMVHVIWGWLLFVGSLCLECAVLFRNQPSGNDRLILAGLIGLFIPATLALAIHETWWRRASFEGTEVIILRGNLLIHSGEAFGYIREWQHRLDKVRKVLWLPRGSPNRYVSSVTLWCRFPNMFVVGWGLEPEDGKWLADELGAAAEQLRGIPARS